MSDAVTLAWIGAAAVVASGLIGAGGVLFGARLTARNERNRAEAQRGHEDGQWQRGQRRDAYAELVRASERFDWCVVDFHDNFRDDPSNPMDYRLTAAVEEAFLRLDHATSEVMLLGSRASQRPALDHASQANAMIDLLHAKGRPSEKAWLEAREKLSTLRYAFLSTARRDLGADW